MHFQGRVACYSNSALFVAMGQILICPYKKIEVLLQIVFVVVIVDPLSSAAFRVSWRAPARNLLGWCFQFITCHGGELAYCDQPINSSIWLHRRPGWLRPAVQDILDICWPFDGRMPLHVMSFLDTLREADDHMRRDPCFITFFMKHPLPPELCWKEQIVLPSGSNIV